MFYWRPKSTDTNYFSVTCVIAGYRLYLLVNMRQYIRLLLVREQFFYRWSIPHSYCKVSILIIILYLLSSFWNWFASVLVFDFYFDMTHNRVCNTSSTTDVTSAALTTRPSEAPEFNPGFKSKKDTQHNGQLKRISWLMWPSPKALIYLWTNATFTSDLNLSLN